MAIFAFSQTVRHSSIHLWHPLGVIIRIILASLTVDFRRNGLIVVLQYGTEEG